MEFSPHSEVLLRLGKAAVFVGLADKEPLPLADPLVVLLPLDATLDALTELEREEREELWASAEAKDHKSKRRERGRAIILDH
ncbi:hypothetical protein NM688_g3111 [Phlebia brevispora]|uniref:Uncharacterized protein n=1 Tax=Phlebia brevispora TaxID=194682 RepID=A0ACC1T6R1_9APHY|nr:hypothetical protein NM688_g3111 [Phlebia brevispora]